MSRIWPTPISISRSAAPTAGDCFARYLVRMAEMRESLKIVEQAVENLPAGPVNVGIDERTALPDKQQVYSTHRRD